MKLTIKQSKLLEATKSISPYMQSAISNGFGYTEIEAKNNTLTLVTSNSHQTAIYTLEVDSIAIEGNCVVNASQFNKLIGSLENEDTVIEIKNKLLEIKQGKKRKYSLPVFIDEFIAKLNPLDTELIEIGFSDKVSKASYALGDNTRNCTGCFWVNDNAIAASNGYTLCEIKLSNSSGIKACVFPSVLKNVSGEVKIRHNDKQIDIESGNLYVSSTMTAYEFPPYTKIIPNHSKYVVFDKKESHKIFKRLQSFSPESRVLLNIDGGIMKISTTFTNESPGKAEHNIAEEELPVSQNSDFNYSAFINANYIISTIASISSDTVKMYVGEPLEAIVFKDGHSDDFTGIVMAMH